MITTEFFGGLGNNLFQLATVYSIHRKYGLDLQIPSTTARYNIELYDQESKLEFEDLFDNKFNYNNELNLNKYVHPDVKLTATDYSYKPIPILDNTCYYGYFQSERYFQGIDIQSELILSKERKEFLLDKYKDLFSKKTISLHYRLGGDRVTSHMQHYHKNVSLEYYSKALSLISEYNRDDYNILVFSDNIKLAEDLIRQTGYSIIPISNSSNVLDFIMMSMCDINIVGNSTFSWWAAYLNSNKNKKVIVTEQEWFGPGYKHFNLIDTFPKSWIRL
jgi:hypothetical protein